MHTTVYVYVSVCLCPARSHEQNLILPQTFCLHKELLVSCTNCLTSSLPKCKVVNSPFVFFWVISPKTVTRETNQGHLYRAADAPVTNEPSQH